MPRLSLLRRFVMFAIFLFFCLQYLGLMALTGSLTGSTLFGHVSLLDPFAWLESVSAAKTFSLTAVLAVVPVLGLYLLLGRAFCGWVCPMDFLFEIAGKLRPWHWQPVVPAFSAPLVAFFFLATAAAFETPVFSSYLSPLTNIFRAVGAGVFLAGELPADPDVLFASLGVIVLLLLLELVAPRYWCRGLCPVGWLYGLSNRISRLHLRFDRAADCSQCLACNSRCYMGIDVAAQVLKGQMRDANCIFCGRCQDDCPTKKKVPQITFNP